MQPTLSHQFYCCMFPHTLDHNCTCQNNPSLGFLACPICACIFIHQCAHGGVGGFSFPPYTPSSCACLLISLTISFIIIHHNRHHADGGVGNSSSSYTPPSACVIPSHSSTFIIIFIPLSCVPSYAQSYQHLLVSGVGFTEHQPSPVIPKSLDFNFAQS